MEVDLNKKEKDIPKVPTIQLNKGSETLKVKTEPSDVSNIEDEPPEERTKKNKVRKRKKTLHAAIRSQMEFYFSDANVSKDRFMQNAIKEGPELSLEVFMNFNKLRSICDDIKEVVKALKYSTILKVSEDETKVSRLTPFSQRSQEEIDQCTIYVEQLPPNATLEWVTRVFTEFGSVAYISLPKFKDASRIKGFAFVEFSQVESAAKALEAYSRSGAAYSASLSEDPGQLCSIQAFNAESLKEMANVNKDEKTSLERNKKRLAVEEDGEMLESKRLKLDTTEKVKKEESTQEERGEEPGENDENNKPVGKVKRKRKKEEMDDEAMILSLQVMSKTEWKKLRNKYLNMQRKCYRQVRNQSNPRWQQQNKPHQPRHSDADKILTANPVTESEQPIQPAPADFQAGVIVKIVLDEPISDAKRFKEQVKSQDGVTYVEAQDCKLEAFVRCSDPEVAKNLVAKKIWTQSDILQGDEEKEYWRKIEENRIKKRDRGQGMQKKSGAEKARQKKLMVERVIDADQPNYPTRAVQHKNLHIRFDDD